MSASHQLLQEAKRTDPSLVIFELVHSFTLLQLLQSQGKEQTTDDKIWTTIGRALANAAAAASPAKTADIDAAAAAAEAHVHNRKALHASGNGWITVTRTEEEVSVLVEDGIAHDLVEAGKQGGAGSRWEVEDGWACLRVRGPMALNLTGIAADFTRSLQRAEVAVFVISTWNTDWIFIKRKSINVACKALSEDGWQVMRCKDS